MINSSHWEIEGKPDGGVSYGEGFCISWQRGPLTEGRNGAFLLDILEVCKHQLEYYQNGQFACEENAKALECIEEAIDIFE